LTFWRQFSASQSTPHASNIAKGRKKHARDVVRSDFYQAVTSAEHTEANLLPCNAAARLQARREIDQTMFPVAKVDQKQEQVIREFAMRIMLRRWAEFDVVWETANRLCDSYGIGTSKIDSQPENATIL
jgi:hypothetical protein